MVRIQTIALLTLGVLIIATGITVLSVILRKNIGWSPMLVSNPKFADGGMLPASNTCDGDDVNPSLSINDAPPGTQSLMVDLIDPSLFNQQASWVVWNISADVTQIPRNTKPDVGVIGLNSFGKNTYTGPCPTNGSVHHYRYEAYALNTILDLPSSSTYGQVQKAIKNHVIGYGALTISYSRQLKP